MSYLQFLSEHGPTLLLGTVTTIKVFICSLALYIIISMIFGLMRLSKNLLVQGLATVYIEFFRGTSLLVQLFWAYYVLPFFGLSLEAFAAGVLTLGMNFGAYGAEVVRAGILAVPKGQWEAAHALNFTPAKRIRRIIIPQIFPIILPPASNLTVELLKATSLVALVTVVDLTFEARQINSAIEEGLRLAEENSIKGKDVTPFILAHVVKSTSNSSLQANLALVENNARVGAEIAKSYGA